ncbi:MAG: hypothetical protein KDA32_10500 [Phycisphaerales bacterium]|nr:hypothetical protein [Phycisphaerales bacterium]
MQIGGLLSDNALIRALSGGGTPPIAPASATTTVAKPNCDCGEAGCATCGQKSRLAVEDTVELSPAALAAADEAARSDRAVRAAENAPGSESAPDAANGPDELTDEEKQQVEELEQRDREVRQHEAAHSAAAGAYANGAPTFDYQTGPDGKHYAVGGEVKIDTSPIEGDPAATIAKLEQVRAAALAPAEPSGQDRSVAAQANAGIAKARAEQTREASGASDSPEDTETAATDATGGPDGALAVQNIRGVTQPDDQQPRDRSERKDADSPFRDPRYANDNALTVGRRLSIYA